MGLTAPSVGRVITMVVFTLSCFGILLFLWLSFGGQVPLKSKGYRIHANFSVAATLAVESDVRIAGVNVGRVKKLALAPGGRGTKAALQIHSPYAPIPEDSRAILRQKSL